jgi:hypothetical protein
MARGFIDTLKEMRDGNVLTDLSTDLAELVSAVRATGKAGKLQLTITVKPVKKGGNHTLLVEDEIKVKQPEADREGTILYATDTNELSRRDPRQPELTGLREVQKVTAMPERIAGNE